MKQSKVLSPLFHLADFDRFPPSIENLNPALTINGITVLPTLRYNGKDANANGWNPWGYGQFLTLQAGTAPTYNNGSPLLGSLDDTIKFNSGGYYLCGDTTSGNVGTNDICIEMVFSQPILAEYKGLVSKWNVGSNLGWGIYTTVVGDGRWWINFVARNGANLITCSPIVASSYWCYVFVTCNMAGDNTINALQFYINNKLANSAIGGSWGTSNIDNTTAFMIGNQLGAGVTSSNIAYFSMWQQANWIIDGTGSNAEIATIASTRFAQLIGAYPNQSRGTYLPSVATRNSTAYLEKIEENGTKKLYLVGTNWIRSNSTIDSNNKPIKGLLIEPSSTNNLLQSETFQTTWSTSNIFSTSINVINSPNGLLTSDGLICSSSNTSHFTAQASNLTNNDKYCFSVFAKAGDKNWIGLSNDSLGNAADGTALFDITNNVVGTKGTLLSSSGLIPYQNGWYRPYIVFNSINGANTFRIYVSSGNNLTIWTGDNTTKNMYVWGAQLELGTFPSSYIPTTTAAVTRAADSLRFVATNNINPNKGSLIYDIYTPSYNIPSSSCPICISNAGSSTIQIASKIDPINDAANLTIYNTSLQCSISGSTDIASGKIYTIKNSWNSDFAGLEVNQTPEGTDSSIISIPTGLNRIDLSDQSATNQFGGLIKNIKIYDDVLGKGKLK